MINKKKRTSHLLDFAVPVGAQSENKRKRKYRQILWLARELKTKKKWNIGLTVILIATGALGTVSKGLETN